MGPAKAEERQGSRLPSPAFVPFSVVASNNITTAEVVAAPYLLFALHRCALQCERDRFSAESATYPCEATATNRKPTPAATAATCCLQLKPFHIYPGAASRLEPFASLASIYPPGLLRCACTSLPSCCDLPEASLRSWTKYHQRTQNRPTISLHTSHHKQTATARRLHVASAPTGCMTAPRLCPASS